MNIAYLVDRHADETPDAPAIIFENGHALSWAEFARRSRKLAGSLRARGLAPGDRLALLAPNVPAYLETVIGCARAGVAIVPLNYRLAPAEIAFQLEDADCALAFVHAQFAGLWREAGASVPSVAIEDEAGGAYAALLEDEAAPLDLEPLSSDHPLGIFYTGGTTGTPKGVVLTHQNLLSNASHIVGDRAYTPQDVHLHVAPMFHLADLGGAFGQLFGGGAHAFLPQFEPAGFLAAIERYGVTTMTLAPTMLVMALRDPSIESRDLASLRLVTYGGSPITEATLRRAMELLPCEFHQGYGQTEATHTICTMPPDDHRLAVERPELLRSCGKPVPGVQLRIVDANDEPVPPGEIGELIVRGPTVMKGYWKREAETREAMRGGWLHTGDLGRRDPDGFVYLQDRKKDMIVTGAENVYSIEVENALSTHPDVVESAVIGVPDDKFGERVHAVVVLVENASRDEAALQAHCRKLIAGYKIPRSFDFAAELPKSGAGKIRKSELRAPYWENADRAIG